jgi:type II secretory pathway pseudopilin PulG
VPIKDCKAILLPLETNILLLTYIIISRSWYSSLESPYTSRLQHHIQATSKLLPNLLVWEAANNLQSPTHFLQPRSTLELLTVAMSTADTAQKQVKTENQQCPTSGTVAAGKHGKDRQKPKNGVKDEAVPQATVASSNSEVPNPLFSRLSSGKVMKDAGGEAQPSKAPSRNRSQAGASKAPRQRKKPAVNQVAEVTKHLHTKLEKDDGVAVECTFLAEDGRAVVSTIRNPGRLQNTDKI